MKLIKQHINELQKLCEKFNVSEFYLVGSALKDNFSDHSDIDFLVRFNKINPVDYFDNYIDFKDALSKLLSRKIDLIEIQTLRNPILIKSINKDKILIYGRENSKMAV